MKKLIVAVLLGAGLSLIAVAVGCHADDNDPEGQAKELSDPVRRENAIANLMRIYTNALSKNNGNRAHADVKGIADTIHDELTATYIDHPEDTQSGRKILDLMYEMRDARTIPALLKALEWRPEVTEEHAISAAKTLAAMEIPADKKGEVVDKIGGALEQISGARPVDNRMRIEFIRALGAIGDRRATPVLTKIATNQVEEQNFLINRLAAEQIARIADPEAVPAMVKGLFLFAPNQPQMRMNDVAAQALVAIGRPALEPLLNVLRGQDAEANAIVTAYIAAVRERNAEAAATMDVRTITSNESSFALGQLGLREAIQPLLAETQLPANRTGDGPDLNENRRIGAVIALVSINRQDADTAPIREALIRVYNSSEKMRRMQLLVAMQHLMDPGLLPFFLEQARQPEDELPDIRVLALKAYAFLADASEVAGAQRVIDAEPEDGFKRVFQENTPALQAATACNNNVDCWIRKLDDSNERVARKAAYMLARYGRGNPAVIRALVNKLNHREEEVRGDLLYALDFVATAGSPEAVAKIEELREAEEGRAIWNHIKELALAVQARLRARGQGAAAGG